MKKAFASIEILVVIILLAVVGIAAFMVGGNKTKEETPSPTPTSSSEEMVEDEMSEWERYQGNVLSFKYPLEWSVSEGSADYYGGEAVVIKNEKKSVTLTVYPAINNRFPYGFGNPQVEENTINVNFGGKNYDVTETTIDQRALYAEVFNDGEYSFLFGTGYPSGSHELSSLEDYYRDRDNVLKILSTFEFKAE